MRQQINTSPPLRSSLPYSDRGGAAKYIVTEGHVRPAGVPLGTRDFHVTGRLSYISKDGVTYCRLIKLGKTFQVVGSAYKQAKAQESITPGAVGAGLLKSSNVLEVPRTLWNYTAPWCPPPDFAVIGWRRAQALTFFFSPGNANVTPVFRAMSCRETWTSRWDEAGVRGRL